MNLLRMALCLAHGILVTGARLREHQTGSSPLEITPAAVIPLAETTKTLTKIRSTTESSLEFNVHLRPWRATRYTALTVTSYEPRPTFTSYPGTVIQKVVSSVTIEARTTYIEDNASSTEITSWAVTVPETWVISRPTAAAKLIPAGTSGQSLSCGGSQAGGQGCVVPLSSSSSQEDPLCLASGLTTGCMGQCVRHEEENEWWCYMMHQRDYPKLAMGRACWGSDRRFRQLSVPCLDGDLPLGCSACGTRDQSYFPSNWEGPEASNDGIVRES